VVKQPEQMKRLFRLGAVDVIIAMGRQPGQQRHADYGGVYLLR
jgi:hypothetical protein